MLVNKEIVKKKNLLKFLEKFNLELPKDQGMLLINIFHKETKSVISTGRFYSHVCSK